MKRILSFIMAFALMLTMSIPAFATGADGQIIITNATIGETYKLYKIFDASLAEEKDENGKPVISYTIDTKIEVEVEGVKQLVDNPVYAAMFTAAGSKGADYFNFVPVEGENKGNITRKATASAESIQQYLNEFIENNTAAAEYAYVTEKSITAGSTLMFDGLDYGYYMIDKANATYVTLTSTTPSVNVIDKNQIPGDDFDKFVWDEETETWKEDSTANIGDILKFKIDFEATNYNGEFPVKYYTVKDTKGSALWVEFNNITVKLETGLTDNPETTEDESVIVLDKGYYHYAADPNVTEKTNEWTLFGAGWTEAEKAEAAVKDAEGNTQHEKFDDDAEWYLIHRGYDAFDIVIPWMEGHDFTGTTNDFTITYGEGATSKYPSPVTVVVEYTASVEPSATLGQQQSNNLWNTAKLTWTAKDTTSNPEDETTDVTVYALGITKTDEATKDHLAGAVFELYREAFDGEGKSIVGEPVYVIPTDIKGVYIVDDYGIEDLMSGNKRESARKAYEQYLADYLGADYETTEAQKNVLTTEVNGKILVKGLEAGNYYLKETKAPDGYNMLTAPTLVTVGDTNNTFIIISDANGNVYNEESASGDHIKNTYTATTTEITNNKGVELPSTGGEGAMKLITFGTITAIAFAALLITHKKMTVYED